MDKNLKINFAVKKRETIFDDGIVIEEVVLDKNGEEIKEKILKKGNYVGAIIKDTVKNKYIFISNYKTTVEGVIIEMITTKVEQGEKMEESLKRVIIEQTGYKVDYETYLKDFYISPNESDEVMTVFYVEVSEKIDNISNDDISIIEIEMLGLGGRLFFEDPLNSGIKIGSNRELNAPYQIIDAKTLIAVMCIENNNTLKNMSDVITQAKLRSL